jgi:ribonuclease Z
MTSDLRLQFFGTSSAVPTKERGLSCLGVFFGSSIAFFDCGEGAQRSILQAGLGFNKDCNIFITHMHGDHVVGLLGILQTMAMNRRDKPVGVYGPKKIVDFIKDSKDALNFGMTFDVLVREVKPGLIYDEANSKYRVYAEKAEHSTQAFAYIFEEKETPGKFHPEKALKLGVPEGPLWSKLQHGEPVLSPKTGRTVKPAQLVSPPRKGRRIGISGDTRPTKLLEAFFKKCDVLVFDSTYSDKHEANALENLHSTSREAATLARNAKVHQLILTHFSARYRSVSQLVRQAREEFPPSLAAKDYLVYEVPTLS